MTLKITLTVDQDHGEQLIGLLAKAFGRGELGIGDIRIERTQPLDVGLKAIHQSVESKLPKPKKQKVERKDYSLGMRAQKTGKQNGVVIALRGLSMDASRDGLREMFKAYGVNPNGVSPTLSKLQKRGYIVNVSKGVWRLSTKGVEFVKQWEKEHGPKVERHDGANGE